MIRVGQAVSGRRAGYNFKARVYAGAGVPSVPHFDPERLRPGMVARTPDGELVKVRAVLCWHLLPEIRNGAEPPLGWFRYDAVADRADGSTVSINARTLRPVRWARTGGPHAGEAAHAQG